MKDSRDNGIEKQLYSMPGVVVIGSYVEEEFTGLAGFTVFPYRMISVVIDRRYETRINTIPFSLGGDIVEKVFSSIILEENQPSTLLEEHVLTMMFIGGFVVTIKHATGSIRPLTLFMPSTVFSYKLVLDEKHEEDTPLYDLKHLIMLGFLLQEGSLKKLKEYCDKENNIVCRTRGNVVYVNIWRRNVLAITSRGDEGLEQSYRVLVIYPDNNPFRHVVYQSSS